MNDFTKEELKILFVILNECTLESTQPPCVHDLKDKIKEMTLSFSDDDIIHTVATGELLFHDKESASAILPKIHKHFDLCENEDEDHCFRIDWQIHFGKKFGR